MKKWKRFICMILCIVFTILSFTSSNEVTVCAKSKDNYLEWKQYDTRWKSESIGDSNMGAIGCTTTSLAILLKHSGRMSDDFTPKTFVKAMREKNGYSGRAFIWGAVSSVTNGEFEFVGKQTGSNASLGNLSKYFKKGNFITFCVHYSKGGENSTHWVAVIDANSSEKSKIKIADPGHNGVTTMKQLYEQYDSVSSTEFSVYSCKKAKSVDLVSSTGEVTSSGGNSSKNNNDDKVNVEDGASVITTSSGNYAYKDPVSGQIHELSDEVCEPAYLEDLSQDQLKGVSDWKNNIDYIHGGGIIKYIRIFVNLIGILFLVWMVLIYMSYWYDRINNFIDIELLPIVTAGQLKVSPEEDNCTFRPKGLIKGTQQTVNHRAILGICLIGIGFAVLLISGKVYDLLAYFTLGIKKLLRI